MEKMQNEDKTEYLTASESRILREYREEIERFRGARESLNVFLSEKAYKLNQSQLASVIFELDRCLLNIRERVNNSVEG